MSFNAEKMAKLILNECESIENRCGGYRKKVLDAIVEILNAEKDHKVQKTKIQQQVDTACHAAGDFLERKRDIDNSTTETTQ